MLHSTHRLGQDSHVLHSTHPLGQDIDVVGLACIPPAFRLIHCVLQCDHTSIRSIAVSLGQTCVMPSKGDGCQSMCYRVPLISRVRHTSSEISHSNLDQDPKPRTHLVEYNHILCIGWG